MQQSEYTVGQNLTSSEDL